MRSLTSKSCDDVVIVIVFLRVAHVHVLSRNRLNEISRGRGHVSPFLSFPQGSVQIPPRQKYPFDLLRCRIILVVVLLWHALLVLALFRLVTAHRLKRPEEGRCISLSLVFLIKKSKAWAPL